MLVTSKPPLHGLQPISIPPPLNKLPYLLPNPVNWPPHLDFHLHPISHFLHTIVSAYIISSLDVCQRVLLNLGSILTSLLAEVVKV
jgi:hypothetical protein